MSDIKCRTLLMLSILFCANVTAFAQGTAFTYQGKLNDGGSPASGQYDFQFKLFDTATVGTGTQQGSMVAVSNVTVAGGVFTAQIDFGACASCFDGSARFLEIAVKPTSGSTFTTLGPRQPVNSTPYSIKSQNSATADGLSVACINCITSSQIASVSGSSITGMIPVESLPSVVFSISGFDNIFVGDLAGFSNTTGQSNAFFGSNAGFSNTTGQANAFFGNHAGFRNTTAR